MMLLEVACLSSISNGIGCLSQSGSVIASTSGAVSRSESAPPCVTSARSLREVFGYGDGKVGHTAVHAETPSSCTASCRMYDVGP